jgi:hypothetical protein
LSSKDLFLISFNRASILFKFLSAVKDTYRPAFCITITGIHLSDQF